MGKPSPPPAPDYVGAARAQGQANENSAIATNFLNQANQVGPNGSLTYTYDASRGYRLPDGTMIPQTTATTVLSPAQQRLLDQQTGISTQLNDLASQGIGYVGQAVGQPVDQSQFTGQVNNVPTDFQANRDQVTNAMMARLQPSIDQGQTALDSKLANQGITQGSDAYDRDQRNFQQGVNDQRTSALLAGDQEEQNLFNRGLASSQFTNQSREQAIQQADYFRNQPLNMLNALRTGNQASIPQFGNVSGNSNIAPPPVYQATGDQYNAAMQQYQAQLAQSNALMSGVAGLGGAAIMASDRRLKKQIRYLFTRTDNLGVYLYKYIWENFFHVGVMADEVAIYRPEALGPTIGGYATVNYGKL